jgi:tetratricopeptide (TPR) repeat protein
MTRVALAVLIALLLTAGLDAGNRAYRDGRYADAERAYREALAAGDDSPLLRYNLGSTLLRLGRHDEAQEQLRLASEQDVPPQVRQAAHYNTGNAGLEPAFADPVLADRMDVLRAAISEYRSALLLDAGDEDAKWNLELAQRLLDSLAGFGGGGGGDGGGGGGDGSNSDTQATPQSEDASGGAGRAAETAAEQVLREAASRDRELHEQRLRRTTRPPPGVRDW